MTRPRLEDGLIILIPQRQGGGQEQSATALWRAMCDLKLASAELLVLGDELADARGWLGALVRWADRRSTNLLYAFAPLLGRRLRRRTVLLYQGLGFLLIPYLRAIGCRVIALCDAPPRPMSGLKGMRERVYVPLLRFASHVARTYDFKLAVGAGPVIPNVIPDLPARPRAFAAQPIRRLLFVGRLSEEKGLADFLRLAGALPELEFEVYGAGAMEGMIRDTATGNLHLRGYSRAWRDDAAGACLVGCAPMEACWTAGKEALLNGIPIIFVPSVTGGPQLYPRFTDKAVEVASLSRANLLAAIERLERAIVADSAPATRLWSENQPSVIAGAMAALCAQDAGQRPEVGA